MILALCRNVAFLYSCWRGASKVLFSIFEHSKWILGIYSGNLGCGRRSPTKSNPPMVLLPEFFALYLKYAPHFRNSIISVGFSSKSPCNKSHFTDTVWYSVQTWVFWAQFRQGDDIALRFTVRQSNVVIRYQLLFAAELDEWKMRNIALQKTTCVSLTE